MDAADRAVWDNLSQWFGPIPDIFTSEVRVQQEAPDMIEDNSITIYPAPSLEDFLGPEDEFPTLFDKNTISIYPAPPLEDFIGPATVQHESANLICPSPTLEDLLGPEDESPNMIEDNTITIYASPSSEDFVESANSTPSSHITMMEHSSQAVFVQYEVQEESSRCLSEDSKISSVPTPQKSSKVNRFGIRIQETYSHDFMRKSTRPLPLSAHIKSKKQQKSLEDKSRPMRVPIQDTKRKREDSATAFSEILKKVKKIEPQQYQTSLIEQGPSRLTKLIPLPPASSNTKSGKQRSKAPKNKSKNKENVARNRQNPQHMKTSSKYSKRPNVYLDMPTLI